VIERAAARVLLIDGNSVLLLQGVDPGRPGSDAWWFTPGGGVDDGESIEAAAVREVEEETGLRLEPNKLGPVVATRVAEFEFDGRSFRQRESFFAVRVERFTPHASGWDDTEQRALLRQEWWRVDDLADTAETVYPLEIVDLVRAVLSGDLTEPMVLSGA
jgi:8-oxo-dGTP pyrophosphatase MutT (NUDIX family)